jgi:sterol desaturase/sphingolipid hydroxylase (fatty acid hydroxylase superfamily)
MDTNYIALAIPAFFLLIAFEWWVTRRRGRVYYRLNDSINDLSTGILQQLATLLFAAVLVSGYLVLYEHARIADLPAESALVWIGCFVGVDLLYYWFHRLSHEINFLWAAHVVHHQSEEYNLTVALRQSALQPFFSAVFYWPLALLGFPPVVFLACASFNTLYQFWIHTRAIGRLGPLESLLMTPSHHRVHHGRNPVYIDRNHGGTFILWDKLFGTYEPEGEEVVYGITKPLESWNPLWANLHYWVELWSAARATRRWKDKLRVFLKPPGWLPDDLGGFQPPPPVRAGVTPYDPPVPKATAVYAVVQFVQILALALVAIAWSAALSWGELALLALGVTWGLVGLGGLFDRARWAGACEWARLLVMPVAALALVPGATGLALAIALLLNGPLAWRLGVGRGDAAGQLAGRTAETSGGTSGAIDRPA